MPAQALSCSAASVRSCARRRVSPSALPVGRSDASGPPPPAARRRANRATRRGASGSGASEEPLSSAEQISPARSGAGLSPKPSAASDELDEVMPIGGAAEDVWAYRRRMTMAMLAFVGPALTIPLADPMMSLVDTVCIGRYSDTAQLAGLGPVSLIFGAVNYIWTSQGVSTTSLMASALNDKAKPRDQAERQAADILSASVILAAVAGTAVCVVVQLFAPQLIALTGAAPELMGPGLDYLRIRAFATPAVFATVVMQAGLMAQRNSLWPSLVILASCGVNIALDLLLIITYKMGAAGAAWATLASQYVSLLLLLVIVQGFSRIKLRMHIPTARELKSFQTSTSSLAFIYVCKNLCYMCIQRVATALPVISLAAHQPVFSLWSVCSFCTTPLEQASLAFIPTVSGRMEKQEITRLIMTAGLVIGLVAGSICYILPAHFPHFFTPDVSLYPIMRSIAPQAFFSLVLAGLEVAATGILISKLDYQFIGNAMTRTMMLTAATVAVVHTQSLGLEGIWWTLVVFFCARALQSVPRMLMLVSEDLCQPEEDAEGGAGEERQQPLNPAVG